MKYNFRLSIGYSTASHSDVIDVDDEQLAECRGEADQDALIYGYWTDWASNYIESEWEPVE